MQDLHSSGTVQKNADDEVLFKIQKLSIIPQDHIVVQTPLNEVLPSTHLPRGSVDDDDENEFDEDYQRPGETSVGKKLWKFLTT
ncbi:hypothetical protein P8452_63889 [Trifolium repens]|nr:hypothetical protein P8452_63889 [Trifolium repens]